MQTKEKHFSDVKNNHNNNEKNKDVNTFTSQYLQHYSDDGFWNKIKNHYKTAGHKLLEIAITLFYTLRDADTPKWAKTVIIGALGYFILPVDIIPDFVPIVGFTDDFAVIAVALGAVCLHIKDNHKERAKDIIKKYLKLN